MLHITRHFHLKKKLQHKPTTQAYKELDLQAKGKRLTGFQFKLGVREWREGQGKEEMVLGC